jgi:uncharacterized protein YwqG
MSPIGYHEGELSKLEMSQEDVDRYFEFCDTWVGSQPAHQLGGIPQAVQDDVLVECALSSKGVTIGSLETNNKNKALMETANQWRLILQIDSDDLTTFDWGSWGKLYFAIKDEDLTAKAFERTWLVLQCS